MTIKYLGKPSKYKLETYSPNFLDSVKRNSSEQMGLYFGCDYWNAYEFSYLNSKNQPVLECLEIKISMTSLVTVESKSMKLYLASFYNKRFITPDNAYSLIKKDLTKLLNSKVWINKKRTHPKTPKSILLNRASRIISKDKIIKFEGFRSVCPITSQPDWANIYFHSSTNPINSKYLIKLLKSYRAQGDFHETCIESIFLTMLNDHQFKNLTVYGRFLRRGGIDINPMRSTHNKYIFSNHREFNQ